MGGEKNQSNNPLLFSYTNKDNSNSPIKNTIVSMNDQYVKSDKDKNSNDLSEAAKLAIANAMQEKQIDSSLAEGPLQDNKREKKSTKKKKDKEKNKGLILENETSTSKDQKKHKKDKKKDKPLTLQSEDLELENFYGEDKMKSAEKKKKKDKKKEKTNMQEI